MELVIEHIKNYIPQLGYASFTWRPRKMVLNEQEPQRTVMAQNEYWYLIPQAITEGVKIIADNDYIVTDPITTAEPKTVIRPLTGHIDISIPANTRQVLIFIQVIPNV